MDPKPYLSKVTLSSASPVSTNEYPFSIPAIKKMTSMELHRDVTFIVGENGSGKSTLIEAVVESLGLSQEGGSMNMQTKNKSAGILANHLNLVRGFKRPSDYFFLRAESFYNVATSLGDIYEGAREKFLQLYGVDSLHECSHGESFLAIMARRLGGRGLYIFDEPEAALSPGRQLVALKLIENLVKQDSQFIIATHSPILLAYPESVIYQLDDEGINLISYEETEAYSITKSFLNDYKFMVKRLLEDET